MIVRVVTCQGCGKIREETEAETVALLRECVKVFGEAELMNGGGAVAALCEGCYQIYMKWEMERGRNARAGSA
jgi:hypothetical protein